MNDLNRFYTKMAVDSVDYGQRTIVGHASVHSTEDLIGDIIEPGAYKKTLSTKSLSNIDVFIGHDTRSLPVGVPTVLRVDQKGLYSETLVKPGPVGDDLLATAIFMKEHGRPLGQSIGFYVPKGGMSFVKRKGKTIRLIKEIDLHEYSFASGNMVAHPDALTMGVKIHQKGLTEAGEAGNLVDSENEDVKVQYSVKKDGDKFTVVDDDGKVVASYDNEEDAKAKIEDLQSNDESDESKTVWNTAYVNSLPDSSFLFIEDGGQKDEEGKTVPRSKRHFPIKDSGGKVDLAHVRDAVGRIPQSNAVGLSDSTKKRLQTRARAMLGNGSTKTVDLDQKVWQEGAALSIRGLGLQLLDLSVEVADELNAMQRLDTDTKGYQRIRPEMRQKLGEVKALLADVIEWSEYIDREQDGEAQVARRMRELELLGV